MERNQLVPPHDYYVPDSFSGSHQQSIGPGCYRTMPSVNREPRLRNYDVVGVADMETRRFRK